MVRNCSSPKELYLWDLDKHEEPKEFLIRRGFESAQIAACIQNYDKNKLVVIEFELDPDQVNDDDTHPNMIRSASYIKKEKLSIKDITNVYQASQGYVPSCKLLYLIGVINQPHFNLNALTQKEYKVLKRLQEGEYNFYWLFDVEYEKISKDVLKTWKE